MTPTPPATPSAATDPADAGPLSPGAVRALKISIVVMGALIVFGIVGIIARIMYMSGQPKPGVATRLSPAVPSAPSQLVLPAGATVRHVALDGARLAVHYEGASGSGIKILDSVTGQELTHVRIVPAVPAN